MGAQHPGDDLGDMAAALLEVASLLVRQAPNRQGMSLTTGSVLGRLHRDGPLRLTALATAEGIAQPSMTQLVQKLERHGLAVRLPDPQDGRVCLVELTEAGREALAQRRRERQDWLTGRLAQLHVRDRDELDAALRAALPIVRRVTET